jgi:hypothetical protein
MTYFMDAPIKTPRRMFDPGTVNPMIPQPLYNEDSAGPAYLATDGYAYPLRHAAPGVQGLGEGLTDLLGGSAMSAMLGQAIDDNWPKIDANVGKTLSKYTLPLGVGLAAVGVLSAVAMVMVIRHEQRGMK